MARLSRLGLCQASLLGPWCCDRSESPRGPLLTLRDPLVAARYTVGEALIAQPAWEAVPTGISANQDECQSIRMSANREERPRCPPVYLSAGGRERYGPPPPATGHLPGPVRTNMGTSAT